MFNFFRKKSNICLEQILKSDYQKALACAKNESEKLQVLQHLAMSKLSQNSKICVKSDEFLQIFDDFAAIEILLGDFNKERFFKICEKIYEKRFFELYLHCFKFHAKNIYKSEFKSVENIYLSDIFKAFQNDLQNDFKSSQKCCEIINVDEFFSSKICKKKGKKTSLEQSEFELKNLNIFSDFDVLLGFYERLLANEVRMEDVEFFAALLEQNNLSFFEIFRKYDRAIDVKYLKFLIAKDIEIYYFQNDFLMANFCARELFLREALGEENLFAWRIFIDLFDNDFDVFDFQRNLVMYASENVRKIFEKSEELAKICAKNTKIYNPCKINSDEMIFKTALKFGKNNAIKNSKKYFLQHSKNEILLSKIDEFLLRFGEFDSKKNDKDYYLALVYLHLFNDVKKAKKHLKISLKNELDFENSLLELFILSTDKQQFIRQHKSEILRLNQNEIISHFQVLNAKKETDYFAEFCYSFWRYHKASKQDLKDFFNAKKFHISLALSEYFLLSQNDKNLYEIYLKSLYFCIFLKETKSQNLISILQEIKDGLNAANKQKYLYSTCLFLANAKIDFDALFCENEKKEFFAFFDEKRYKNFADFKQKFNQDFFVKLMQKRQNIINFIDCFRANEKCEKISFDEEKINEFLEILNTFDFAKSPKEQRENITKIKKEIKTKFLEFIKNKSDFFEYYFMILIYENAKKIIRFEYKKLLKNNAPVLKITQIDEKIKLTKDENSLDIYELKITLFDELKNKISSENSMQFLRQNAASLKIEFLLEDGTKIKQNINLIE